MIEVTYTEKKQTKFKNNNNKKFNSTFLTLLFIVSVNKK